MRKKYSPAFKAETTLELLKEEKTIAQIASARHVHTTQLNQWKALALKGLVRLFTDDGKTEAALKAQYAQKTDELYAEIGRLTTQVNWLKKKSGIDLDAQ
jgi:transposase-like protein